MAVAVITLPRTSQCHGAGINFDFANPRPAEWQGRSNRRNTAFTRATSSRGLKGLAM